LKSVHLNNLLASAQSSQSVRESYFLQEKRSTELGDISSAGA